MRKWIPALAVAAVLVALLGAAAGSALTSGANQVTAIVAASGSDDAVKSSAKSDKVKIGHGPPSWARQGDAAKGKDKSWKAAWRALSSAQRSELMEKLGREHAAAMEVFGDCVAAERSDCVKPLPPGHAKRS